jgi:hypothetical protein
VLRDLEAHRACAERRDTDGPGQAPRRRAAARPSLATAWLGWSPWPGERRTATICLRDRPSFIAASGLVRLSFNCRAARRCAIASRGRTSAGTTAFAIAAAASAVCRARALPRPLPCTGRLGGLHITAISGIFRGVQRLGDHRPALYHRYSSPRQREPPDIEPQTFKLDYLSFAPRL